MNLTDCKKLLNSMELLTDLTTDLEYSNQNTLTQDRKDLHRNLILPMMNTEFQEMKNELKDIEQNLIKMGYTDLDNVDIDLVFGELDE